MRFFPKKIVENNQKGYQKFGRNNRILWKLPKYMYEINFMRITL
jgi:hypothetical protein